MNYVIITAGGKGTRMGSSVAKQYLTINNKPILYYSLKTFQEIEEITGIVLVVPQNDLEKVKKEIIEPYNLNKKLLKIITGGKERQDSIFNALNYLHSQQIKNNDKILIHDGVRPFISQETIIKSLSQITKEQGIVVGVKVKDTIKEITPDGFYTKTLNRDKLIAVQTPQGFLFQIIYQAYKRAYQENFYSTDDASLVEKYALNRVKMIEGNYFNLKITTTEDLVLSEQIIKHLTMQNLKE